MTLPVYTPFPNNGSPTQQPHPCRPRIGSPTGGLPPRVQPTITTYYSLATWQAHTFLTHTFLTLRGSDLDCGFHKPTQPTLHWPLTGPHIPHTGVFPLGTTTTLVLWFPNTAEHLQPEHITLVVFLHLKDYPIVIYCLLHSARTHNVMQYNLCYQTTLPTLLPVWKFRFAHICSECSKRYPRATLSNSKGPSLGWDGSAGITMCIAKRRLSG